MRRVDEVQSHHALSRRTHLGEDAVSADAIAAGNSQSSSTLRVFGSAISGGAATTGPITERGSLGSVRSGVQDWSDAPNVMVARRRHGLEVLHLYTGRILTRLPLTESHGAVEQASSSGIHGGPILNRLRP
jgi:hypothetical protein